MQKREQLIVGGLVREYLIYIPDSVQVVSSLPVVISFHGTLGSAEQMMGFADFRPIAERELFLIVCPEGITQTWNDGRATKANQAGIDDVTFIAQLIDHLISRKLIDSNKVYLTGMSNGGFMASRLACELPERIAAMAAVASTLDKLSTIRPAAALPVMYIHGTKDRLVPFIGGATKAAGGDVYGHEDMLNLWVEINQCREIPITTYVSDEAHDGTTVIKQEFVNPQTCINVIGYTVVGGGHTWPSGPQYASRHFVGLVSHNLNACEVIWNFFKLYSKVNRVT